MDMNRFRPVRGAKDLAPDECYKFLYVRRISQEIGERYGFLPIETPILEYQDVFLKTLGDASDIIGKEMYSFVDKGGDVVALRPEFTAAVARMLICERLPIPARLFTTGPVFRYERPQKCRQRQFHQVNYECFGIAKYTADVEIISLAHSILSELKLCDKVRLEINSLGTQESMRAYREELLRYLDKHRDFLSEDSRRRLHTNPLRVLDSKDPRDAEVLKNAPTIERFYDEASRESLSHIRRCLDDLGIAYHMNPYLVRGLDYYCGVVFEFKTRDLGSQDAVIAGGRYDRLLPTMGYSNIPAVGFAGGIERLVSLMNFDTEEKKFSVAILPVGEKAVQYAMGLAYRIRSTGIKVSCDYEIDKLKTALKRVNKSGETVALIIGDHEMERGVIACKNMSTGIQEEVKEHDVVNYISAAFRAT